MRDVFVYEVVSWSSRRFRKSKSKITASKNPLLLDLGAGSNYTEGWVHADFFRIPRLRFWRKRPLKRKPDVELDLRFPLNCEDDIVDGAYSGHTLEHLYPKDALQLLCEVFRVLKPGCWFRVNVPDLRDAIDFYNGKAVDDCNKVYRTGCEAIVSLTQDSGHHSVG